VLRAINQRRHLNFVDRFIYRQAVWETREGLLEHKQRLAFEDSRPDWGPGRVETWNPSYKALQFNFPMEKDATLGAVDLPSIWNQKPREEMHMHLHWDGNNTLLAERNRIAALGAGVTPTTIDLKSMQRIEDWLLHQLQPPPYAYPIDRSLAAKGAALYDRYCATCHAFNGSKVGQVVPISEIGTDPHRLESFTYELDVNMNTLYAGYPWRLSHLRKTNGYTNVPLDGIWLRAPYLHNGSVPTLRDLLEPPEKRPRVFYRGYDVLDTRKVGFISDVAQEKGRKYFRYDTALPGNGNGGHLYGAGLAADEKDALVEYMKKL